MVITCALFLAMFLSGAVINVCFHFRQSPEKLGPHIKDPVQLQLKEAGGKRVVNDGTRMSVRL